MPAGIFVFLYFFLLDKKREGNKKIRGNRVLEITSEMFDL